MKITGVIWYNNIHVTAAPPIILCMYIIHSYTKYNHNLQEYKQRNITTKDLACHVKAQNAGPVTLRPQHRVKWFNFIKL